MMKEIQESLQEIRESQVRMESDLRYHIRRTDLLEHQIQEQRKVFELNAFQPVILIFFFQ